MEHKEAIRKASYNCSVSILYFPVLPDVRWSRQLRIQADHRRYVRVWILMISQLIPIQTYEYDSDQSGHLSSLIRVFAVRSMSS